MLLIAAILRAIDVFHRIRLMQQFNNNDIVVALSHMDDDNAYVFAVGEYKDAYLPMNVEEELTGCVFVRNPHTHRMDVVWEFQSQFFTKDEFRKFIGDRQVKRVTLDDEVKVGLRPSMMTTAMMETMLGHVISDFINSIEDFTFDEEKHDIYDDGQVIHFIDKETNEEIKMPEAFYIRFHALTDFVESVKNFAELVHRSNKFS